MYAGALGDNAVERYAMFLTSLELSADIAERRLALTRARDHGLDMERVAVATAERTIEHAFSVSTQCVRCRRRVSDNHPIGTARSKGNVTCCFCASAAAFRQRIATRAFNRVDNLHGLHI